MNLKLHARVASFLGGLPAQTRSIIATCIYGLFAGLGATLFLLTVNFLHEKTILRLAKGSFTEFALGSLALLLGVSLIVGWLLSSYCPEAAGSGIPQHKLAFWKDFGHVPLRVPIVKFIAGALSVGGGCSLGREGPSVQLAGGLASNLAGVLGEPKQNRRTAAAAGAAAGLAAAFNAPLAGATFVLEEIIADLNSRMLGSTILAAVIGAFVVHGLVGAQPAFILHGPRAPHMLAYLLTPIVAAPAALVGIIFHRQTIRLRALTRKLRLLPRWMHPALGGLATWAVGTAVFWRTGKVGVFGLGYEDLSAALDLSLAWQTALILLGAKLFATIACYGTGGSGGIFAPNLFFGGMAGLASARLLGLAIPLTPADELALTVVGMSACLNAVVRAPMTSILIVFEMTHEFSLVPALMMGALVSTGLARRFSKLSFYEELLEQDGHKLERIIPPRDLHSWQELPVTAIANFQPVVLEELSDLALRQALEKHPYQRWPVVSNGKLAGILTRVEAEESLREGRPPRLEPAITCSPNETIQDLQHRLIQSTAHMVLLIDPQQGKILGLVTLHDLLRAQVLMSQTRE